MFVHFLLNKNKYYVIKNHNLITKWLSVLFGFTFILFVSYIFLLFQIMFIDSMVLFYTENALQILSAAGLAGLVISPLFFPEILYGLPRIPQSIVNLKIDKEELNPLPGKNKTAEISGEERKQLLYFENE